MMRLFDELDIETISTCNRTCPTCLRNSYPDQEQLAGRQERRPLPTSTVHKIIDQAVDMGFTARVCLQHFDEPLMDSRIADLGHYAKSKGVFYEVYVNTNGDYITEERAKELDGAFDRLNIALYGEPKPGRADELRGWFKQTVLTFTGGAHVITHYSPFYNLADSIHDCRPTPCERECQLRMIVDYRGEMLLCCDDIAGAWDLGNVHYTPLKELWFGAKHTTIVNHLSQPGGRFAFPYCYSCPRPNTPYWSVLP